MSPIIQVQWEYVARLSNEVNSLKNEIARQNTRITANQVTLAEIQQQLADGVNAVGGGGMGWPLFKNATYYRFTLAPNVPTKVVESLIEPQLRQLRFRLLSGTECYLSSSESYIGGDWNPLQLNQGMLFQDDHNGGEAMWALAPNGATMLIEIRTAEAAENVGEDFVIPFKAEGILSNGQFSGPGLTRIDQLYNDDDLVIQRRLKDWFNGVQGYRVLDITSFHPGQTYTLFVDVAESFKNDLFDESEQPDYDPQTSRYKDKVIEVWMPNFYNNLPELAIAAIANWYNAGVGSTDYEQTDRLMSVVKKNGWIKSLPKEGGEFQITPDFSRRFVVFYCCHANSWSAVMDNATFTWDSVNKTITLVGA